MTSASSGTNKETSTPTKTFIQTEMTKSWLQFDQPLTPETRSKVQDLQERLQVLVSEDNPVADKVILELSRLSNQEQGNQSNLLPMTKDASQKNDNETKQNAKPPSLDSEHIRNDETQLLRECLYALQGLNGKYLYYSEDGEFQINYNTDVCHDIDYLGHSVLGNGAYDALQLCGRAGWFYCRIQNYIETAYEKDAIARALAEALSNHLNQSYHGTLAKWDAQLQKDLSDGSIGISLRQLMRSMRQPTHQLQILAILVDGISALKGGPLLTALTRHMYHGNTRHSMLTEHMLKAASQPWYHDLYLWTMQGTLLTNKFFVQTQDSSGDNWHTSFQLLSALRQVRGSISFENAS
jgi:Gamma tubulin complex component N-terminal